MIGRKQEGKSVNFLIDFIRIKKKNNNLRKIRPHPSSSSSADFHTPPHNSGEVLWFHVGRLCVCQSIRLSVVCPSIHFSFPDANLSKHQWIFTKLAMCIDIVDIWFGIANGQIPSNFYGIICPRHVHIFVSGR